MAIIFHCHPDPCDNGCSRLHADALHFAPHLATSEILIAASDVRDPLPSQRRDVQCRPVPLNSSNE